MVKITIGDYPPEYKPEVHGPYDPGRYYGKRKSANRSALVHNIHHFIKYSFVLFEYD